MENRTNLTQKVRSNWILNRAYREGRDLDLDELEILKRLTVLLLDIKDEQYQKAVDDRMRSTTPLMKN